MGKLSAGGFSKYPGWPSYTENAYHTFPYIKCVEKCLSYNFHTISKNGWKLV